MDIRGFGPMELTAQPERRDPVLRPGIVEGRRVYYGPSNLEEDIQELVDRRDQHQAGVEEDLVLGSRRVAEGSIGQVRLQQLERKVGRSKGAL